MMNFTEKEQLVLDKFDELSTTAGSARKASQLVGVSDSAISCLKQGKYKGNTDNVFSKLVSYFEVKEANAGTYSEIEYVPTSISNKVYETIRACQVRGGFAVATGDAGIGKTKAIMKFARDYFNSCIVITINPCCKSTKALLKLIAVQVGVPIIQSVDDLWLSITGKLHDGMVIIVDEAQLLPHYSIETLRSFADYFDSRGQTLGIALIGNNGIREKIEGKTKEAYRQINNRTWQRPQFQTKDVKFEDITLLFPILKGHDNELRFLHKVAQTAEGVRGAVRLFSNAYDNERYDFAGIVAMAKSMRMELAGLERLCG